MIPRVLVTPFTGYLSDRFDRRYVLVGMFGMNVLNNLLLAALVMMDLIQIWHLVVLSFLNGSARATQMPASQALIPNLVPSNLLLNGIALNQAALHGSRLIGPAFITPLLVTTKIEGAFLICVAFYSVSLIQALRLRTVSSGVVDRNMGLLSNMVAGLLYVYKTPVVLSIMMLALFHCGLTMAFESMLPILSRGQLDTDGTGFGYIMMGVGGGALLAVVFVAGINNELFKGRLFLWLGVFSGITPAILGISTNIPIALLGAFTMGATQAGFMTLTHSMIQTIIPDGVRGRVGSVYSVHVGGMMALSNLVNGSLADVVQASIILIVGGLLFLNVMVLSWWRTTLRQIYTSGLRPELQNSSL